MCPRGDGNFWSKSQALTKEGIDEKESLEEAPSRVHMIPFRETRGGVTFAIKVHPRAEKNAITGELGDALKVSLIAPPVEGKANEGCIDFFAKLLEVPRSSITIAAGQTSRNKVIRVVGLSVTEIEKRLNIRSPS